MAKNALLTDWYENGQKELEEYYVLDKIHSSIDQNKEGNVTKAKLPTPPPRPLNPVKKTIFLQIIITHPHLNRFNQVDRKQLD